MSLTVAVSGFRQQIWIWLEGQRARQDFALWQAQLGIEAMPSAPEHLDVLFAKNGQETTEDFDTAVPRQQSVDRVDATQQRLLVFTVCLRIVKA